MLDEQGVVVIVLVGHGHKRGLCRVVPVVPVVSGKVGRGIHDHGNRESLAHAAQIVVRRRGGEDDVRGLRLRLERGYRVADVGVLLVRAYDERMVLGGEHP